MTKHFQFFDQAGSRLHDLRFDSSTLSVIIRDKNSKVVHSIKLDEGEPVFLKSLDMELRVVLKENLPEGSAFDVKIKLPIEKPGTNIFTEKDGQDCDSQEKLYIVGESDVRIGKENRASLEKGIRMTYTKVSGEGILLIEGFA